MARSTSGESVLDRALRILEVFASDTTVASLTEIAIKADLPLSTASRLVDSLVAHGLLRRGDDRKVRIGVRMWQWVTPTRALRDSALPFLERAHTEVGHHVQLGVLDRDAVLIIEQLSASVAVANSMSIGSRLPLRTSAPGLVFLAYASGFHAPMSDGAISNALCSESRQREATILNHIRRTGFAVCPSGAPRAATIAVPVHANDGRVIATLSAVLPQSRATAGPISTLIANAGDIYRALDSDRDNTGLDRRPHNRRA